jgi:hypothetical protein
MRLWVLACRSAVAGLCFTLPAGLLAQSTGVISGRVVDRDGSPLAGVTVALSMPDSDAPDRGEVTDGGGAFRFSSLAGRSHYTIEASFPGLAPVIMDVQVQAGRVTPLSIIMQPAEELTERIRVSARPQVVDLDSTTTETRFSSEFVESLPILGRNYQDILTLAPGVTDVDGDGNPNIHGARDTNVVSLIDGISTTDPLSGKLGAQLNIESIQEIEIKTTGATAEYGRAQGGFTNIITKSGGNDLQGSIKFFWRGSTLDGDGAGSPDPLLHGGLGENGVRDLEFNDFYPFLALGGPIVRDRAWFFIALESIQVETPVNALSTAFITTTKEMRNFAKFTWQASVSNRLAFSLNHEPQQFLNEGINSYTREESGFTLEQGGLLLALKAVSVLSPTVALETTVASFSGEPDLIPNLGSDINRNGILYADRNRNGWFEAYERDAGEDWDRDGVFDVFEDTFVANGMIDFMVVPGPIPPATIEISEDADGDGRLTPFRMCEGDLREDRDCDGFLDIFDEDDNDNGRLDPGEDIDGDGWLDLGIEDRNGNGVLDDMPRPVAGYPYGRLAPEIEDRDYTLQESRGIVFGPYYESYSDRRERLTLRQDLGLFVPDFHGTHDLKMGYVLEREEFERATDVRDILLQRDAVPPICIFNDQGAEECSGGQPPTLVAQQPTERSLESAATGRIGGLYVQDTYKPLPNLSFGLGMRFERELAETSGYTVFDPRVEAASRERILAFVGAERGGKDLTIGNGDGIESRGIWSDPLFTDANGGDIATTVGFLTDPLQLAALTRLTRHRSTLGFTLDQFSALFPDIIVNGELNEPLLAELGVAFQRPEPIAITNNNLAPRLSVSWDPWANGRTKLFATWGRYYDKLFLSTVIGESGAERVSTYYLQDADGLDEVREQVPGRGVVPIGHVTNHNVGALIARAPPSIAQVDRNLATPFSDELTIGVEREIAPEMSIAVRYIDRSFREQLQDIDINHRTRLEPQTGDLVDRLGVLRSGVSDVVPTIRVPDGRPDLYVNNFFFNEVLRVGNFNQARYKALEIELVKRLARRWQLQASYTYSRARGDAEDFQSRQGNDPSTIESEFGPLDFDQRHVIKLNAATFLPGDWQLGTAVTWSSGLPYSVISRYFALDNYNYQQLRTTYGFTAIEEGRPQFVPLNRNSERNDAVLDLNLRGSKHFVMGKVSAALFLEVFNLLNTDDLYIRTFDPSKAGATARGNAAIGASVLQLDAERRFGRRYQVGFQFDF